MAQRRRKVWMFALATFLTCWLGATLGWVMAVQAQQPGEAPASTAAAPTPAAPALPPYITTETPPGAKPIWPDPRGDKLGVWANPSLDGSGDNPATLTLEENTHRDLHNHFSINFVWVLLCGFLVMFMQAGFALVETGLCRSKNAAHTMSMNFMIFPLGCFAFWAYGFAIGWGNWWNGPVPPGWYSALGPGLSLLNEGVGLGGTENHPTYGLMGTKGFFLLGVDDVSVFVFFFFMMMFMDTTATVPTGALAERWAWNNFVLFGLWVPLPYCLYANWVWGGGWLAQAGVNWGLGHGAVDFAGSGVVHAMGGAISLAGVLCLGPRHGKFARGRTQAIPGHNIPMVILGTFILAFGWFGFNPGSTLAGTDLRISFVVVNTLMSGVVSAITSMFMMGYLGMRPDPSMMCNGMLAGLVAVTAPCAFIDVWAAGVIGAVAGCLVVLSVFFWESIGIDDPVGAISVHGVNGTWGLIALGLFANGDYGVGWNGVVREGTAFMVDGVDGVRGAIYGDFSQLIAQIISVFTVWTFGFTMAYCWFKMADKITPMRVPLETEIMGLDIPEMGTMGYVTDDPTVAKAGGPKTHH